MWKLSKIIALCVLATSAQAQSWQWTELANMPFRTSNNAVCEATVNGEEFVYSFGGIDTTKLYSGIHKRGFKYEVATDMWSEIDTLPDAEAKIASAASYVKGKIYIIGGYYVYANGNEISSDNVHVYNPQTDSFEADAAPVPLSIDDQVQCVYKDSLIFVVTGWSNTTNWPNVQIYDPTLDQWQTGTPVPNTPFYTAFGASGYIMGDTLYYHGGASGGSFGARKYIRKGYINPSDPTDITWEPTEDAPGDAGYRSACSGSNNTVFWIGGSPKSYNYNGVAYDGTGGVDPSARALHYNVNNHQYIDEINQPYGVMDLRGIAKLSNDRWIICGGMDTNQVVGNRTFLLENTSLSLNEDIESEFEVKYINEHVEITSKIQEVAMLLDLNGRIILTFESSNIFSMDGSKIKDGIYLFAQGNSRIRIKL